MIKKNCVEVGTTPCNCGKKSSKYFSGGVYCNKCFTKIAYAYKIKYGTTNDKELDDKIDSLTKEHNSNA